MKNEAMNERIGSAIEKVIKLFEQGTFAQTAMRTVIMTRKDDDRPCMRWSLLNRIMVLLHETTDARGYRQWQEDGRQVKKGAKAFHIFAPHYKKVTKKELDLETGAEKEVDKTILVGWILVPVFRLEDTEGESLDTVSYEPAQLPPLCDVAERFGIAVRYFPFSGRYYGFYTPNLNEITLCSHDQSVFFHELAHAVYHHVVHPLKGGQDPDQEIVAETCAAVLCTLYGFEGYVPTCWQYIRGYAGADPVRKVAHLIGQVEKVLSAILPNERRDEIKQSA